MTDTNPIDAGEIHAGHILIMRGERWHVTEVQPATGDPDGAVTFSFRRESCEYCQRGEHSHLQLGIPRASGLTVARDLDHAYCPAGSHTFDAGTDNYQGALDEHGRTLCNDCLTVMFHCEVSGWYHHAGADTEPCWLIQEPGQNVATPASQPLTTDDHGHAYYMTGDSVTHCLAHRATVPDGHLCPLDGPPVCRVCRVPSDNLDADYLCGAH